MTNTKASETKNLYQQITDQIIQALEQSSNWVMPWHGHKTGLPKNVVTGKAYSGINVLSLWVDACSKHYASNLWGTYKQWQSLGAQIRKGEKAHLIVFYKSFEKTKKNEETGEEEIAKSFVLKSSPVFNANQVEGFTVPELETPTINVQLNNVDTFIEKTGAKVVHGFTSAFYQPVQDIIAIPEQSNFINTSTSTALESYYGTILHELAHWTGHPNRLNRIIATDVRFGSESYAMEELIAELTAAFSCAELGVSSSPRQDHADYIASWLKVLKDDKRAIFYAARQATLAMDYLKSIASPSPLT